MDATIRAGRPEDGPRLIAIEMAAGARFRSIGMAAIADADPGSVDELAAYATAGRSWVTVVDDQVVAYVVVDVVDRCAHIEQISVHPEHQGRGLARALIDHVAGWAADTGCPALTLTTFSEVEWNRPLYEHLGFRVLTEDEIGPELADVLEHEASLGLDPAIRVCMRRDLAR